MSLVRQLIEECNKIICESLLKYNSRGEADIIIGDYQYIFSINPYPPDFIDLSKYGIKTNAGLRLDVLPIINVRTNERPIGNDLGDQKNFLTVMRLMYSEGERLAKNNNIFIVNDTSDSPKRDSIYDKWATKISNKYGMEIIKITDYTEENIRYLYKK